eukprot:COSAG01_NODE_33348_length_565_cov_2.987124_1_plen_43_part_10
MILLMRCEFVVAPRLPLLNTANIDWSPGEGPERLPLPPSGALR